MIYSKLKEPTFKEGSHEFHAYVRVLVNSVTSNSSTSLSADLIPNQQT